MSNPYEILNIQRGATKDDVRRAYKKLAKQYHPDQYDNNPLRDLAEERMVEINEAYESLMKTFDNSSSSSNTSSSRTYTNNSSSSYNNQNRSNSYNQNQNQNYGGRQNTNYNSGNQNSNYGGGNYNNTNNYSNNTGYNSTYESIRSDIYSGNLRGAEQKLNALKTKDAEWNYLMGILYSKKGWNDSAKRYLSTAVRMNPSHVEYRNAMEQANFQTTPYRQNYYGRRRGNNDMFDLCFKLWCADSLCECAGGDLIDCM